MFYDLYYREIGVAVIALAIEDLHHVKVSYRKSAIEFFRGNKGSFFDMWCNVLGLSRESVKSRVLGKVIMR